MAIVQKVTAATPEQRESAVSVIAKLPPFLRMAPEEDSWPVIQPVLTAAVEATQWWATSESREAQESLHRIAHSLGAAGQALATGIDALLLADLQRAVPYATGEETLAGLREMGPRLSIGSLEQLATAVAALVASGDPQYDSERTLTQLVLGRAARDEGADISAAPYVVEADEVINAAASDKDAGEAAVVAWLGLEPPFETVKMAAAALGDRAPQRVITAFGSWAQTLNANQRTEVLLEILQNPGATTGAWIAALAAHAVDEQRIVDELSARMQVAPRREDRLALASLVVTLRPSEPAAQRKVADLVMSLLGRDTDVDFRVAVATVPALGTDHRSAGRLEAEFRKAADRGRQLPAKAQDDFRRANLKLPEKAFKKRKKRGRKIGPFRLR
jgi:hypothetical protein